MTAKKMVTYKFYHAGFLLIVFECLGCAPQVFAAPYEGDVSICVGGPSPLPDDFVELRPSGQTGHFHGAIEGVVTIVDEQLKEAFNLVECPFDRLENALHVQVLTRTGETWMLALGVVAHADEGVVKAPISAASLAGTVDLEMVLGLSSDLTREGRLGSLIVFKSRGSIFSILQDSDPFSEFVDLGSLTVSFAEGRPTIPYESCQPPELRSLVFENDDDRVEIPSGEWRSTEIDGHRFRAVNALTWAPRPHCVGQGNRSSWFLEDDS